VRSFIYGNYFDLVKDLSKKMSVYSVLLHFIEKYTAVCTVCTRQVSRGDINVFVVSGRECESLRSTALIICLGTAIMIAE